MIVILLFCSFITTYGMDQASSSQEPSIQDMLITVPEDCFDSQFKKGQQIPILKPLTLRNNSTKSQIHHRYENYYKQFLINPQNNSPDAQLIRLIGSNLKLLSAEGELLPQTNDNNGNLPKEDFLRFMNFILLRKTPEDGKLLIQLIQQKTTDKEIAQLLARNSVIYSQTVKHPYKRYLQSLYAILKSIRDAQNTHLYLSKKQQEEIQELLIKLPSNRITTKEDLQKIINKLPDYLKSASLKKRAEFDEYARYMRDSLDGKYYFGIKPFTPLAKAVSKILKDEEIEKDTRKKIAHGIKFNLCTNKCLEILQRPKRKPVIKIVSLPQPSRTCILLSVACFGTAAILYSGYLL